MSFCCLMLPLRIMNSRAKFVRCGGFFKANIGNRFPPSAREDKYVKSRQKFMPRIIAQVRVKYESGQLYPKMPGNICKLSSGELPVDDLNWTANNFLSAMIHGSMTGFPES